MRCLLLLFASLFVSGVFATEHPAQVAGIYEGTVAVKGADGRKIMLNLKQDGAGELRDGPKKAALHWGVTGQELRVEAEGRSAPLLWRVKGNSLMLKDQDRTEFGKKGLVLRRPR